MTPEERAVGAARFANYDYGEDDFDLFVEGYLAGYQADRWIPVSERLPERSMEIVLTYRAIDKDIDVMCFEPDTPGYENGFYITGVTHWQPLPEPPTDKQGNQSND